MVHGGFVEEAKAYCNARELLAIGTLESTGVFLSMRLESYIQNENTRLCMPRKRTPRTDKHVLTQYAFRRENAGFYSNHLPITSEGTTEIIRRHPEMRLAFKTIQRHRLEEAPGE